MKARLCEYCNSLSPYHEPLCRKCGKLLKYIKIEEAQECSESEFHPIIKKTRDTSVKVGTIPMRPYRNTKTSPMEKIINWNIFFIIASLLNILFLISANRSTSWGIPISALIFPILAIAYLVFVVISTTTYNRLQKENKVKTLTRYIFEILLFLPIFLYVGAFSFALL